MHKLLMGMGALALSASAVTSGAMAADPVLAPTPVYNSTTFDWDGFYAGFGVAGTVWDPPATSYGYLNAIAGFNVTSGDMLFGAEAWGGVYGAGAAMPQGGAELRAGYLVSPDALVYLSGGFQLHDGSKWYGQVGAGVELAVSDDLSADLQYKYSGWSNTGFRGHTVAASLNWHF